MNLKKIAWSFLFALNFFAIWAQKNPPKSSSFGKISVSPMDFVSISDSKIEIAPKKEDCVYTISGYFDGQIVIRTKNTVLKMKGAYLENSSGEPAVFCEAKAEISTSKGTQNVISCGEGGGKTGALHSKKNLVLGGSGTLFVTGGAQHGVKADDVKIKGSGEFFIQGTKKGSALNCRSLAVEKGKTFKAYFLNSKNGIKADQTISIGSGKTDTKDEDSSVPHSIVISGGAVHTKNNGRLYESDSFKSRPKIAED